MSLAQILSHPTTLFALFMYCISIALVLPAFVWIHEKLDDPFLQLCWDKVGMPLIRVFLIIGFIILIYPLNFGLNSAPSFSTLLNIDDMRSSNLINLVFILTFFYPLIPAIGKWDELLIPLQGILSSMIIFIWLCQEMEVQQYNLFPGFKSLLLIVIFSIITHWLAKLMSQHAGDYLDQLYVREGFRELIFKGVVLVMQSPIIFIYGLYLGNQINISQ